MPEELRSSEYESLSPRMRGFGIDGAGVMDIVKDGGRLVKPSLSSDSDDRSGINGGSIKGEVRMGMGSSSTGWEGEDDVRLDAARGWAWLPLLDLLLDGDGRLGRSSSRVYVLPGHPRSGKAQALGNTTMGDLSYAVEE